MSHLAAAAGLSQPRTGLRHWLSPLELCALASIWGVSFLFMRVAAPQFGPIALVELRLALGALVLAPLLW
ncbi:EamA/RhaT family transporter, partial [Lysobacter sp. 2RAB21]